MLHLETIEPKTLELLRRLQSLPIFEHSRLVGGTALALQLGHRKSLDLDMFGNIDASPEEVLEACKEAGELEISKTSKNINIYWVDGIKVDCVNYPYKWLDDCIIPDGSRFIAIKSLTYFEDAESDPMPYMFSDITWEEIKVSIINEVRKL